MERRMQKWFSMPGLALLLCIVAHMSLPDAAARRHSTMFSSEKAGFAVKFGDKISPYRVMSVFVLPGERLTLEALDTAEQSPSVLFASTRKTTQRIANKNHYVLQTAAGKVTRLAPYQWQWSAPRTPGLYPVRIIHSGLRDAITLHIFVLVPSNQLQGEYLNGYRIGIYPSVPYKGLPIYKPPRGFVEVTEKNQETLVTPHFTLKQFLCKQNSAYPKYVVLREELLLQLELLLEMVNKKGYRADTFSILSGYRTPFYNQSIGNGKYSRHLWGGAADIFIDEYPKDGMMDDLNQDGMINYEDALILYRTVDELYARDFGAFSSGGLGWYEKTAYHGPFVHVDVRGFRARWGDCGRIMRIAQNDTREKRDRDKLCNR